MAASPPLGILFTDWLDAALPPSPLGQPNPLLPLLDKPLLYRVIERLVELGCRRLVVLLGDEANSYREAIGNSERWGCRVDYHYLVNASELGPILFRAGLDDAEGCWLAEANGLPDAARLQEIARMTPGQLLCQQRDGQDSWAGWAWLPASWLRERSLSGQRDALAQRLLATPGLTRNSVDTLLRARRPTELLDAGMALLVQEVADPVRIGRGCRIDPSARLVPPVWLGRHVHLAANTVIGPHAVIGNGAMIGQGSQVNHSLVQPYTCVGEGLELDHAIAAPKRLANTRLDTLVEIPDQGLLDGLPGPARDGQSVQAPAGSERSGIDPWLAWFLTVVLAPLFFLSLLLVKGSPARRRTLPRPGSGGLEPASLQLELVLPESILPEAGERHWLSHFRRTFFPALTHVRRGRLKLVGVMLRPLAEVRLLSREWRQLYARTRCGLISEASLDPDLHGDADQAFASDALASFHQEDPVQVMRYLRRYLGRVLVDLLPRRRIAEQPASGQISTHM